MKQATVAICASCEQEIVYRPEGWLHQGNLSKACDRRVASPAEGTQRRQELSWTQQSEAVR